MNLDNFNADDLPALEHLQPPDWSPIYPHFVHYLDNQNCTALKLTDGIQTYAVGAVIRHRDSAWLAHIIVDSKYRSQGLGKRITKALIETIDSKTYSSIYLMATPAGYPVYKSLGFETESLQSFYKWEQEGYLPKLAYSQKIRACRNEDVQAILDLDKLVSSENRAYRIKDALDNAMVIERDGKISGFYLPDLLEGPIIAENPEDGLELIKYRLNSKPQAILPDDNVLAGEYLKSIGMKFYRYASRMRLGEARAYDAGSVYNRYSGQIG